MNCCALAMDMISSFRMMCIRVHLGLRLFGSIVRVVYSLHSILFYIFMDDYMDLNMPM